MKDDATLIGIMEKFSIFSVLETGGLVVLYSLKSLRTWKFSEKSTFGWPVSLSYNHFLSVHISIYYRIHILYSISSMIFYSKYYLIHVVLWLIIYSILYYSQYVFKLSFHLKKRWFNTFNWYGHNVFHSHNIFSIEIIKTYKAWTFTSKFSERSIFDSPQILYRIHSHLLFFIYPFMNLIYFHIHIPYHSFNIMLNYNMSSIPLLIFP